MTENSGFLKFTSAVLLGALGGILGCQILLPWLAGKPFFEDISWIKNSREGLTVINRTERVLITEDQGFEEAVSRAGVSIVGVTSQRTEKISGGRKIVLEKPEILAQGTGVFVSSDGLVVVADIFVPENAQKIIVVFKGHEIEADLLKRDQTAGLALIKLTENNISVLPFLEREMKLGERIFLLDSRSGEPLVNIGFVDALKPQLSVFFQTQRTTGGPIFNIQSELVGFGLLQAPSGKMAVVSAKTIREFIK